MKIREEAEQEEPKAKFKTSFTAYGSLFKLKSWNEIFVGENKKMRYVINYFIYLCLILHIVLAMWLRFCFLTADIFKSLIP